MTKDLSTQIESRKEVIDDLEYLIFNNGGLLTDYDIDRVNEQIVKHKEFLGSLEHKLLHLESYNRIQAALKVNKKETIQ